jgi:16S rRNA (uracil1498-N3)-methyltransferase
MQRYFIVPNQITGDIIIITGDDVHHIRTVMRNRPGDILICCMLGFDYRVEIVEITATTIYCQLIERSPSLGEPKVQVILAQGLPKGEKIEWILQKGTELGASSFLPFSSERTVVKLDARKAQKKQERWSKIVKEAAEQAHRGRIPKVLLPVNWKSLLAEISKYDRAFLAYEKGGHVLNKVLRASEPTSSILLIIGPEGGFSEQEVAEATEHGAIPITLGARILRTETAAISLLTCVMYAKNELGGESDE